MGKYYSPEGNYEVWDSKPDGYYTEEEWSELHPPVPYVPTKEEKLAALDAQYDADKAELAKYFTEAAMSGDTETQAELTAELNDLNDDYDAARREIEEE